MKLHIVAGAALCCASALCAQNSDLGILIGISAQDNRVTTGGPAGVSVSDSVGASLQINYAWQVRQTRWGDLFVELPFIVSGQDSQVVSRNVVSSTSVVLFIVPGVRFKVPLHSRIGLYGMAGGGFAIGVRDYSVIGPGVRSDTGTTTAGAFDAGGGLDFRMTRLLSLKLEGRDLITKRGLAGTGHSDLIFQGGISFHF